MISLSGLNDKQREAAETIEGPVLILAGAGSGKTRTITYRIAHMVDNLSISGESILGVSFTNKAAKEMRERVITLLGSRKSRKVSLLTFHSLGVRILKKEQQCVLVICLSHLGYKYRDEPTKICDLKLAELTQDIDLIIGGHTHTFLDKPTVAKNLVGKEVLVNQVGCYGINLGRIDFYLDNNKAKAFEGKSIIV